MASGSDKSKPNQLFDKYIGEKVKKLRLAKKMSAATMSEILGINERHLLKHEEGLFWISAGRLILIAKTLGVPIACFYSKFSNKFINSTLDNSLGARLKRYRRSSQLTMREIRLRTRIPESKLITYERDICKPPLDHIIKLAQLYKIDMKEFKNDYPEYEVYLLGNTGISYDQFWIDCLQEITRLEKSNRIHNVADVMDFIKSKIKVKND